MRIAIKFKAAFDALNEVPDAGRFAALVGYLAMKDSRRNGLAVIMLSALGKPVVPRLLLEAVQKGRRVGHRIRILDVVERIGEPLDFEQCMMLGSAAPLYAPKVGEKIARLRDLLGPPGLGQTLRAMAAATAHLSVGR